jgi:hypothetical protein
MDASTIMLTHAKVLNNLMHKVYMKGMLQLAFNKKRSWMLNRIRRGSLGVKGLQVHIDSITDVPWSWTQVGEHGTTPDSGKWAAKPQYIDLNLALATAQMSAHNIRQTAGNADALIDMQLEGVKNVNQTFPYFMKQKYWSRDNGFLCRVGGSPVGNLVTLDNAGMDFGSGSTAYEIVDRTKLLVRNMQLQIVDGVSGLAKNVRPVRVEYVDRRAGKIRLDDASNVADNDYFVISDVTGANKNQNSGTGIYDVIDNSNTLQGIDRSVDGNEAFRAVVHGNSGTPRALTYGLLHDFFFDCYHPDYAITSAAVARNYLERYRDDKLRYLSTEFTQQYTGFKVDSTAVIVDDDADSDKVFVIDLDNVKIAEPDGGIEDFTGNGWYHVPKTTYWEYVFAYWAVMYVNDARYCGKLVDINPVAA